MASAEDWDADVTADNRPKFSLHCDSVCHANLHPMARELKNIRTLYGREKARQIREQWRLDGVNQQNYVAYRQAKYQERLQQDIDRAAKLPELFSQVSLSRPNQPTTLTPPPTDANNRSSQ
jgi:hypothetical protein